GGLGRRGCGEFAPPEVEGGGAQVVSGTVASYGESGRRVGLDVALPPGGRGRRSGIHARHRNTFPQLLTTRPSPDAYGEARRWLWWRRWSRVRSGREWTRRRT